jgi:hypothetical protein
MAITRVVDQSRNEHREVSIHLEWRRIPSNPHLFPPEWQIADPWNAPSRNDGQAAMSRTMHRCDRPDKLPSISIDQRISRHRQSQAFYTNSIALVRLGRNHHERDCKRAQGRKITKKCSSGTFLPQLESVSKARPKGLSNHCHRRGIDPAKLL